VSIRPLLIPPYNSFTWLPPVVVAGGTRVRGIPRAGPEIGTGRIPSGKCPSRAKSFAQVADLQTAGHCNASPSSLTRSRLGIAECSGPVPVFSRFVPAGFWGRGKSGSTGLFLGSAAPVFPQRISIDGIPPSLTKPRSPGDRKEIRNRYYPPEKTEGWDDGYSGNHNKR
jgi:hypothetical protein